MDCSPRPLRWIQVGRRRRGSRSRPCWDFHAPRDPLRSRNRPGGVGAKSGGGSGEGDGSPASRFFTPSLPRWTQKEGTQDEAAFSSVDEARVGMFHNRQKEPGPQSPKLVKPFDTKEQDTQAPEPKRSEPAKGQRRDANCFRL